MLDITFDRQEESTAEVLFDGDRAVIDVSDSRGINGLTARLAEGEWPETVTVRLHLRGLEHLEISYDSIRLTTGRSANDSSDPPLMLTVTDEQGQTQSASPSADIYYPEIEQTGDGFEITLPAHFYHEARASFSMRWIDFYR